MQSNDLEKRLWESADLLRANSKLLPSQYSRPVLGIIFLRFADHRFQYATKELETRGASSRRGIDESDYHALGVMYIPEVARWSSLLNHPEGIDLGREINKAMSSIEDLNEDLRGALPRNYSTIENKTLVELLRIFDSIPIDVEGDLFGRIFEYFLGQFAMKEGQAGGTFYTPSSVVRLIVEILEPNNGKVFDPACGSGGMFVQSAKFLMDHTQNMHEISIYGTDVIEQNVNLSRMNLAIHRLSGQIRQANSYYEDPFKSSEKFDFVMANPPFNVDKIDKDRIKDNTARFPLGMPTNDNGNYIWIQMFYGALNEKGRAGFVMPNSACDAKKSEREIRKKLIQKNCVDVIVSVGKNFFYTVTLSSTLWFLDKNKKISGRENEVLFIDARHIYHEIDRVHREFTEKHIEFISNIVRLYKGKKALFENGSENMMNTAFPRGVYEDVLGLCKVATLKEIEEEDWSLNPGRYVGVEMQNVDIDVILKRLQKSKHEIKNLIGQNITSTNLLSSALGSLDNHVHKKENYEPKELSYSDVNIRLCSELSNFCHTIYTHWFENFRYPSFDGKFRDSELGKLPSTWKIVPLRDILSEVKSTIRKGEKFPYVGMSDINPKQRTVVSNEVSTYGTGSRFKAGDILFARITPCLENGKIAQFKADEGQEAFGSTEFFVFRSNELVHQSYLYYLLRSYRIRKLAENSMVGASGRQRADLSFLTKQLVPLPPMELQEMFANIVDKM